jgi:hypothetical protein
MTKFEMSWKVMKAAKGRGAAPLEAWRSKTYA